MESPGVRLPPPVIYIAFYCIGLILEMALPLPFPISYATRGIGWAIAFLSLVIAILGFKKFRTASTTIRPDRAVSSLITTGIFTFTRNPLYLSLVLLYCGIGIFFGEWWPLVLTPFLVMTMNRYVIRREESYLAERFGQSYDDYRKRVRRWI